MKKVHFTPPARRDQISQKVNYKDYQAPLEEDFKFSCGYCGDSHIYGEFHIDHFRPRNPKISCQEEIKRFKVVETDYNNLVYSCPFCNRSKSNKWPTKKFDVLHDGNVGFIDPCDEEYNNHIGRRSDGRLYAKTTLGNYIHKELKFGLLRHQLIWLMTNIDNVTESLSEACDDKELEHLVCLIQQKRIWLKRYFERNLRK